MRHCAYSAHCILEQEALVSVFKLRCVTRSLAVKLMSAKAKRQRARAENRTGPQSTVARISEYEASRMGVDVPDRFRAVAKR
jgi:hypothetical protein